LVLCFFVLVVLLLWFRLPMFLLEELHEANAGRRWRWSGHRLRECSCALIAASIGRANGLRFPLEVDLHLGEIERIETYFVGFAF
jgi:hypothetical protein